MGEYIMAISGGPQRFSGQRMLLILLGIVCLGLVAGALYFQEVMGQAPCPLCIVQRYLFLLIALVAFVGASFSSARANRGAAFVALLIALVGVGVAARLVYVQGHPAASCGIDVMQLWTDAIPLAQWMPTLFQATGMCGDAYDPILGLGMAQWSLTAFVVIAVAVAIGWWNARRRPRRSMFR
ncbi:disulfide bond formation protein B [Stutzerimonas azotifigens]|nr:disulfide bond formation protein B [Stutzerimonas azotifigens]